MKHIQKILAFGLIFAIIAPFTPLVMATDPVITVDYKKELSPGEPQNIQVNIGDVSYAMYFVLVFNPGDLDTLEQNQDEFYEWLRDYDWDNYDKDDFKDDLDRWNQASYNIDLALRHGYVHVGSPSDEFGYPYDFEVICGNPGTYENGEYDMVFIGISGGFCMFSMDTFKYMFSFFVIPEVPLGTIMTLIPMIGSLVVLKRKEIF